MQTYNRATLSALYLFLLDYQPRRPLETQTLLSCRGLSFASNHIHLRCPSPLRRSQERFSSPQTQGLPAAPLTAVATSKLKRASRAISRFDWNMAEIPGSVFVVYQRLASSPSQRVLSLAEACMRLKRTRRLRSEGQGRRRSQLP